MSFGVSICVHFYRGVIRVIDYISIVYICKIVYGWPMKMLYVPVVRSF